MSELAGSYFMGASRLSHRGGIEKLRDCREKALNPQARVVRRFNLKDSENVEEWNDFLNDFAFKNDGIGTARMPGNIKVTYLDTADTGRMFSAKFPDHSTKKLLREMRRVKRDFDSYVKDRGDNTIWLRESDDAIDPDRLKNWIFADFNTNNTIEIPSDKSKKGRFPFSHASRRTLNEEKRDIISYFKRGGFQTHEIEVGEPHITFFTTFRPIADLAIKSSGVAVPENISLWQPTINVISNERPQEY